MKVRGTYLLFLGLLFFLSAGCEKVNRTKTVEAYPITEVPIREVKLTDDFWLPLVQRVQEKTIHYALEKCRQEGRFDNFLIAGGQLEGEVKGSMPFDDTDVYKVIEGASNSLISSPNEQLEVLLDSLIAIIAIGQEPDGYLTTWRTINPAKPPATWVSVRKGVRWESLSMSHELYNAGHLYEAAVVHYQATGKRNFLEIALENADLIVNTFGPGKLEVVPGHQIIETGLIKLFSVTGERKYLELAKYFLDGRGEYASGRTQFGEYAQDHLPVIDQEEVVGHAVRAVYMYAGMTDIAAIYQDTSYWKAVRALWENMVQKKVYLTGGIGAKHEGESFGANYELPNKTAYNETCAAIGSVYWNHRLFMLEGDKKYYEVIERVLYNGLISGLSLDGEKFFYPNALESDGIYTFNQGSCTRKNWFDCSCCPTNLIRFLPAVSGLIYAQQGRDLYVNLFIGNETNVTIDGQELTLKMETQYPWDGQVKLTVRTEAPVRFNLKIRIPAWVKGEVLDGVLYRYAERKETAYSVALDGDEDLLGKEGQGYYSIDRKWSGEQTVLIDFPMEVRRVQADERVAENDGKVALEYGPLVYAFEETDNKRQFQYLRVSHETTFQVQFEESLLQGVNTLKMKQGDKDFTAIPYYSWCNRGVGKMKVWIPTQTQ